MTLDEMISVFKNGDLQDIDYELMINAEQFLYWLTEYRAMISGRHSGNLSERLAEHLVWAESNSYECPVTLAEDLQEAISVITAANKVIEAHDNKIAELETVIYGMDAEIKRLQSVSSWIPCSVKLPEVGEPVLIYEPYNDEMVVVSLDCDKMGFSNDDYYYGLKNVPFWMQLPEKPKEVHHDEN